MCSQGSVKMGYFHEKVKVYLTMCTNITCQIVYHFKTDLRQRYEVGHEKMQYYFNYY